MWNYNHTPADNSLCHAGVNWKNHKYIAKIGEGINAKYFYTREELAAYKRALSSKDEAANVDRAKSREQAAYKQAKAIGRGVDAAKERQGAAERNYANAERGVRNATKREQDAVNARKQAARDLNNAKKPENVISNIKKQGIKKGLSLEDEKRMDTFTNEMQYKRYRESSKAKATRDAKRGEMTRARAETERLQGQRAKAQANSRQAYADRKQAERDYAEARTVRGKAKAVRDTFDQYHPGARQNAANNIRKGAQTAGKYAEKGARVAGKYAKKGAKVAGEYAVSAFDEARNAALKRKKKR